MKYYETKLSLGDKNNNYLFGCKQEQAHIDLLESVIAWKPAENILLALLAIVLVVAIFYPPGVWVIPVILAVSIVAVINSNEFCNRKNQDRVQILEDIGTRLTLITNHPVPPDQSLQHFTIRHVHGENIRSQDSNIRVSFFEGVTCYVGERCRGEWKFYIEDKNVGKSVQEYELERLIKLTESIL